MAEYSHTGSGSSNPKKGAADAEDALEIEFADSPEAAVAGTESQTQAADKTGDSAAATPTDARAQAATAAEDDEDFVSEVAPRNGAASTDDALTEDEMAKFSEDAQKRFRKLARQRTKASQRADAAEAKVRELNEILAAQRAFIDESRQLIENGESQYVNTARTAADVAMRQAQDEYRAAYESGDADKLLAAQLKLNQAQMYAMQAQNYQPVAPRVVERAKQLTEVRPEELTQQPDVHPATLTWQERNPWFTTNARARDYAIRYAMDLESQGVTVANPRMYFGAIDTEMQQRFPELYSSAAPAQQQQQRRAPGAVVAPATTSAPTARKVVLPSGAREIAARLGIPIEVYAKEYLARSKNS